MTLPELRNALGTWRTIRANGSDALEPPVVASWECGCVATGNEFTSLNLRACPLHVAVSPDRSPDRPKS